jgi:hypothetical protein
MQLHAGHLEFREQFILEELRRWNVIKMHHFLSLFLCEMWPEPFSRMKDL